MQKDIHLGYEIGTGEMVSVPLHHVAVSGQTQLSGKTTTLEAMIARSGLRAIAFVTKRAEGGFLGTPSVKFVPPYFRNRSDWMFVSSILGAILKEKLKFQRAWIMEVCKHTMTLKEVHMNVKAKLVTVKRGLDRSVYTELDEYLGMVIPEIDSLPYETTLKILDGLNVMDLSGYSTALQMLVISSVVQHVYEKEQGVITIIPEAWEFAPQKRSSPVLQACEDLIRKGGSAGNFVWFDTQDLAAVNKDILKSVGVYILGVQRERNEVIRTVNHTSTAVKPKPSEIMSLHLGEFYVCHGSFMKRTYVQPVWMDATQALSIATGKSPFPQTVIKQSGLSYEVLSKHPYETVREDPMRIPLKKVGHEFYEYDPTPESEVEDMGKIVALEAEVRELKRRLAKYESPDEAVKAESRMSIPSTEPDYEAIYNYIVQRAQKDPLLLKILSVKPEIEVTVTRQTVKVDGGTIRGRLARLLADGFFDRGVTAYKAHAELLRLGKDPGKANVYREMKDFFLVNGFVTLAGDGLYKAVPDMKINVIKL